MSTENRWLLPEGIDELLPERAGQLEALRRRLLEQCATWGYRYVIPPLVEFTDSLLIGLGADLDVGDLQVHRSDERPNARCQSRHHAPNSPNGCA